METNKPIRLMALAAMPTTKADLACERAEFLQACARAEAKGNRARELIDSPECCPDLALVAKWANDFKGASHDR